MSTAEDLIQAKTTDFVGRQYIFDAVDEFIRDNDRGFFVLEGDPGAGKTSILAEYIRRTHCIGHFNLRAQGLNTTQHFIRSLSRQMADLFGTSSTSHTDSTEGSGEAIARVLHELRVRLPDELPLVVAVDALDEVASDSDRANPLFIPSILAEGVYFILTTRRQEAAVRFDSPFHELDLKNYSIETMTDVRQCLENKLSLDVIARRVDSSHMTRADFVTRLADMSEGNFMYLQYTLNDIARSPQLDLDRFVRELPRGLENYYEYHWRLMGMAADGAATVNAWILYVLCEAAIPLPAWIVSSAIKPVTTEASPALVQSQLNTWLQFLHADSSHTPTRYSIYHASFRDFLHRNDVIASAGLDLKGVNKVIAELLWRHEFGDDDN